MFIFEKAPFPSCHASTLVEHEPGKLLAAWFGGKDEGAKDVQIWSSTFDGKKWGELSVIGTEPGQPCWNPVLFKTAKGTLYLWYKAGPSPTAGPATSARRPTTARRGRKPEMMPARILGPVRAKPIQLANGTILAGTSWESYRNWTPFVDRSTDDGKTWDRSNPFPMAGEVQPDSADALRGEGRSSRRAHAVAGPAKDLPSESKDGGKTFTPAEETDLANPSAGIDVREDEGRRRLPDLQPGREQRARRSASPARPTTGRRGRSRRPGDRAWRVLVPGDDRVCVREPGDHLHVAAYPHQTRELRPADGPALTSAEAGLELTSVKGLAKLLDECITIPGTNRKVGLDAILGLIPGVGDLGSAAIGGYILLIASKLGVPAVVLWRMLLNLAIDTLLGAVPFIGDLFDAAYRANSKNAQLLMRSLEEPESVRRSSRWMVFLIAAAFLAMTAVGLIATFLLVRWVSAML